MAGIGFLPCFSRYLHKRFPISDVYTKASYVEKVKRLVAALLDCPDPLSLKSQIGRHDIQPIRPDDRDSREIIAICDSGDCSVLLRIDYGDNPFRIVLGLSKPGLDKNAYIFFIDTKHTHFNRRRRRQR